MLFMLQFTFFVVHFYKVIPSMFLVHHNSIELVADGNASVCYSGLKLNR